VIQDTLEQTESFQEPGLEEVYKEKFLRALADLENHKKRALKEREDLSKYRYQELLRDLIPVLDNFDRALNVSGEGENKALLEGMVLVRKLLDELLTTYGLERIDTIGYLFDPYVHEAVGQQPSNDYESGVVIEEVSRGYIYQDKLLLAAKVIVSA
jgi:molecular chaperone GrpE